MNKTIFDGAQFQGVKETQKITGLSRAMLYNGANSGMFPHIRSGNRILFNIPKLLELLDLQSQHEKESQYTDCH